PPSTGERGTKVVAFVAQASISAFFFAPLRLCARNWLRAFLFALDVPRGTMESVLGGSLSWCACSCVGCHLHSIRGAGLLVGLRHAPARAQSFSRHPGTHHRQVPAAFPRVLLLAHSGPLAKDK